MRLLPDGRVLWYLGDMTSGIVYPSRQVFAKLRQELEAEAAKGPVDLTRTLLPPIDDFLRDPGGLAKQLGKAVHVPDETLDGSIGSIDVAYKALLRMRSPKRKTAEVVGPLTAYVGEVMRRICGGSWTKSPTTKKESVPVYDPADQAAWTANAAAIRADADKAVEEVKARRGSGAAQGMAFSTVMARTFAVAPKPIRFDVIEVSITGHENEPMILARDGALLQPFALVLVEMTEHGPRGSLAGAVSGTLARYPIEKRKAATAGGG